MPVDDFAAATDQQPGVISCYADVVPGRYVLSARVGYATALTDWYAREIAGGSLPADIDEAVGWPLRFSGLIAYPSFGRLLAPDWNEGARAGAILGLTLAHKSGDILQALVALGYSDKEAQAALKSLPKDVAVSEGIKQALKALAR